MEKLGLWDFRIVDDDPFDQSGLFRRRYYCPNCGDWQTYGATKYCPNCGANMSTDGANFRTVDVGFLSSSDEDGFQVEDEVEFDLVEAPLADMVTELFNLFRDFCDENGISGAQPLYANEVPYDGELDDEFDDDEFDDEDWYEPDDDRGFYSPSCPWNAPGMSPSDFI